MGTYFEQPRGREGIFILRGSALPSLYMELASSCSLGPAAKSLHFQKGGGARGRMTRWRLGGPARRRKGPFKPPTEKGVKQKVNLTQAGRARLFTLMYDKRRLPGGFCKQEGDRDVQSP